MSDVRSSSECFSTGSSPGFPADRPSETHSEKKPGIWRIVGSGARPSQYLSLMALFPWWSTANTGMSAATANTGNFLLPEI